MKILKTIFSIYNDKSHKVICILGFKIKFKRKNISEQSLTKKMFNLVKRITPPQRLHILEMHIVEHCNLNCYGCLHFSPLAKEEFLNIQDFEQDLKRMHELTQGDIEIINILGGEPLLHPNCTDFLRTAREIFPNSEIKLITNGILLPEQEDFFYKTLSQYSITLEPTKYPIDIDWNKITKKVQEYNVKLHFYGIKDTKTNTGMVKACMDIQGKQDARNNFLSCQIDWEKPVFWLSKGKIYGCEKTAYIEHFNKYFNKNFEVTNRDYIDIYKVKDLTEILEFKAKPVPFCKYCNMGKRKWNLKWKHSKKEISEWT